MMIKFIPGAKQLWKAWSMRFAALGVVAPEVMQLISDNSSLLPWLDDEWKSIIRMGCLIGVVLARPVKQIAIEPKETPTPKETL